MIGSDLWESAVRVGVAGLSVDRFVYERNPLMRLLSIRLAEAIIDRNQSEDQSRANKISNAVWAAVRRGGKK